MLSLQYKIKREKKWKKNKEMIEIFLPEGIMEYFEYSGYKRKSREKVKPYGEITIIRKRKM